MTHKRLSFWIGLTLILTLALVPEAFSQAQAVQSRIPQQIIINGQRVNGVHVLAPDGGFQSFTCPNPQQYVTADGSSQGWACFEQATGVWLLNALPPVQAQVPPQPIYQQPTIIYQPAPAIIYTAPAYPVYSAPVYVAPVYSPSVVLGTAAIHSAGHIASAAVISHYGGGHYGGAYYAGHSYGHHGFGH